MISVRPATSADEGALGRFGAALLRQHHDSDPKRFLTAPRPEGPYGRFLVSQIPNPGAIVLVAEFDGTAVGYIFADIEGTSWMDLRGPCGQIHDIYVDASARQQGAGRALMQAAIDWIRSKGMRQVVLSTKTKNLSAQRLFEAMGFRDTMIEMTKDLDA